MPAWPVCNYVTALCLNINQFCLSPSRLRCSMAYAYSRISIVHLSAPIIRKKIKRRLYITTVMCSHNMNFYTNSMAFSLIYVYCTAISIDEVQTLSDIATFSLLTQNQRNYNRVKIFWKLPSLCETPLVSPYSFSRVAICFYGLYPLKPAYIRIWTGLSLI